MKRKLKTRILVCGISLVLLGMSISVCQNTSIKASPTNIFAEDSSGFLPRETLTDYLTLRTDPRAPGETETPYNLEILFSPQYNDYKSISKDSAKNLFNNLIEGLKDIVASQIKFIKDVESNPREIDNTITSETETVDESSGLVTPKVDEDGYIPLYDALIKGLVKYDDSEKTVDGDKVGTYEDSIAYYDSQKVTDDAAYFTRTVLAYLTAYGNKDKTKEYRTDLVNARLGTSDDGSSFATNSGVGKTLVDIYVANGMSETDAKAKANEDLSVIYDDALEIVDDNVLESSAISRILLSLGETKIPTQAFVDVLGPEDTKLAVEEIFISGLVTDGKMVLDNLETSTVDELCKLVDFTKQEIKDVIDQCSNSKLLEIFNSLDANGLDNIRVILGNANDSPSNDSQRFFRKRAGALKASDGGSRFMDFGNELISQVMARLTPSDLLQAVSKLTVDYTEENMIEKTGVDGETIKVSTDGYLFYRNESVNEDGEIDKTLPAKKEINLNNIRRWFRDKFPTMEEIKNRPDAEQRMNIKMELFTPLSPDQPIFLNATIGFQNKDCKLIRKVAGKLDQWFDIEYDEDDLNKYKITFRSPQALENIYGWLCDSGFIKNDNHYLNDLWTFAHSTFGNMINEIQGSTVDDLTSLLKELDYEKAVNALTSAEILSELLNYGGITQERLEKAYRYFFKLVNKVANVSYDAVADFVKELLGNSVSRIVDNATLKKYVEKIQDLLKKIQEHGVDFEYIKTFTNEHAYQLIERLTGKVSIINRVRDLLVRVLKALPERFRDNTILDLYNGNGSFSGSGEFRISWESWIKKLPLGDKLWSGIFSFVVGLPETVSLDIDATLYDTHEITYDYGDSTQSGLLHKGSDVMTFGDLETYEGQKVIHWLDKDALTKTRVDEMPDKDIVVVPETLYSVSISSEISEEETYDPNEDYDITVSIDEDHKDEWNYTYQWQKFDETAGDSGEFVDISGETSATLTVQNVNDSGTYRCVVNNDDPVLTDREVISDPVEVSITKKAVDITVVTWDYTSAFTYDGEAKSVAYDTSLVPEGATFKEYSGDSNSQTDADTYSTTAVFELTDADNYYFKDDVDTIDLDWEIEAQEVSWEGPTGDTKNYTGNPITFDVASQIPEDLADKIEITSVTNNVKTEPGTYTMHIEIAAKDNYVLTGSSSFDVDWTIVRIKQDVSFDMEWDYTAAFTYDGNAHTVAVIDEELPEQLEISYSGSPFTSSATEPGDYTAYAQLKLKEEYKDDYNLVGTTTSQLEWKINKAVIDISGVEWEQAENTAYTRDGNEHKVNLKNVPEGVTVQYTNNKATDAGSYTATAVIVVDDPTHYTLSGDQPTSLHWSINHAPTDYYYHFETSETDSNGNSIGEVTLTNGILDNVTMTYTSIDVSTIDQSNIDFESIIGTDKAEISYGYDFGFEFNSEAYNLSDADGMLVNVLIPEEIREENFKVVTLNNDGSATEIENYEVSENGIYVSFNASSVDKIYFVTETGRDTSLSENIGVLALIIIGGLSQLVFMYYVTKRSKKDHESK